MDREIGSASAKIMKILQQGPESTRGLVERIGLPLKTVQSACKSLVRLNKICIYDKRPTEGHNRPVNFYALVSHGPKVPKIVRVSSVFHMGVLYAEHMRNHNL